jgi:hypothetical protein
MTDHPQPRRVAGDPPPLPTSELTVTLRVLELAYSQRDQVNKLIERLETKVQELQRES